MVILTGIALTVGLVSWMIAIIVPITLPIASSIGAFAFAISVIFIVLGGFNI